MSNKKSCLTGRFFLLLTAIFLFDVSLFSINAIDHIAMLADVTFAAYIQTNSDHTTHRFNGQHQGRRSKRNATKVFREK